MAYKKIGDRQPAKRAAKGHSQGYVMPEEQRHKIANSNILNRLVECALGNVEMTSVQAQVAMGLLRKIMPDLASTELTGNDKAPVSVKQIITGVPRPVDVAPSATVTNSATLDAQPIDNTGTKH